MSTHRINDLRVGRLAAVRNDDLAVAVFRRIVPAERLLAQRDDEVVLAVRWATRAQSRT